MKTQPPSSGDSRDHLLALDGVRGLACLLIVLHHYLSTPLAIHGAALGQLGHLLSRLTEMGRWGVDLFFALSGFLIGRILLSRQPSPGNLLSFASRRLLRVVPAGALTLLFIWSMRGRIQAEIPSLANLLSFGLNFHLAERGSWLWSPLDVFWSVCVELQFYALAPLLAWGFRPRLLGPVLLTTVAISALVRGWLAVAMGEWYIGFYVLTPFHLDALLLGMTVAWAFSLPASRPAHTFLRNTPGWLPGALFAGAVLTELVLAREGSRVLDALGLHTLVGLASALVVARAASQGTGPNRVWLSPSLRFLGRHSYGIYLWHTLVWYACNRHLDLGTGLPATLATSFLAFVTVCALAALSLRCFETPLNRLGHRIAP